MRILVASDQWFPDVKGGSARVATNVARGLARRGHHVTVIVPGFAEWPRVLVEEPRLTVRRVLPRTHWPVTLTDPIWTAREASRLRGERFDVLVGHQSTTTSGLWAARLQTPLVCVFHASAARELRFLRSLLPLGPARLTMYPLELHLAALERFVARRAASKIVTLSEFSRSLLREDHGTHSERIQVLPGGVDVERFAPADGPAAARARLGVGEHERLLVTVRRLEPRMGLEQLLRALPRLTSQDVTLTVVGGGTLEASLHRLAADLGVAERVRFTGRVPEKELHDWYRAAEVFVLPTAAYEGFGMVTAEALATGTPVVGTPVGATPELLLPLEPRLVARGTDAGALADAISLALDLADETFRRRCREYACARFSLDRAVVEWEQALTDAIGRGDPESSTEAT